MLSRNSITLLAYKLFDCALRGLKTRKDQKKEERCQAIFILIDSQGGRKGEKPDSREAWHPNLVLLGFLDRPSAVIDLINRQFSRLWTVQAAKGG
jgi:hypothetical protein